MQWQVHLVNGLAMVLCRDVASRHSAGITTGWLTPREPSITDTSRLHIDIDLLQTMARSFGATANGEKGAPAQ